MNIPSLFKILVILSMVTAANAQAQKADGYYRNAISSVNAGDLDQAYAEVNQALELDDRHAESLILRAYLLLTAGEKQAALKDYSAALQEVPSDIGALTNRALLCMEMEKYEEALADLKKRLKQDPYNWMAHYDLAYCYGLMGKYDLAITGFTEVVTRNPEYPEAYLNRGFARYNKHSNAGMTPPAEDVMLEVCEDFYRAEGLGSDQAKEAVGKYCE